MKKKNSGNIKKYNEFKKRFYVNETKQYSLVIIGSTNCAIFSAQMEQQSGKLVTRRVDGSGRKKGYKKTTEMSEHHGVTLEVSSFEHTIIESLLQ